MPWNFGATSNPKPFVYLYNVCAHLSLFRYLSFSLQLGPGLPPLEDPVVLLGIHVEWLLLNALAIRETGQGEQGSRQVRQHLMCKVFRGFNVHTCHQYN